MGFHDEHHQLWKFVALFLLTRLTEFGTRNQLIFDLVKLLSSSSSLLLLKKRFLNF